MRSAGWGVDLDNPCPVKKTNVTGRAKIRTHELSFSGLIPSPQPAWALVLFVSQKEKKQLVLFVSAPPFASPAVLLQRPARSVLPSLPLISTVGRICSPCPFSGSRLADLLAGDPPWTSESFFLSNPTTSLRCGVLILNQSIGSGPV